MASPIHKMKGEAMGKISKKKLAIIISICTVALFATIIVAASLSQSNKSDSTINQEEHFTVSFDTGGGEKIESQKVLKGDTVKRPQDPTKDGSVFDGWYADKNFTNGFDFKTIIDRDLVIYAKWIAHGSTEWTENNEHSNASSTSENNSTSGNGGHTSHSSSTTSPSSSPSPSQSPEPSPVSPSSDPEPTPTPQKVYYTVSFNSNGGTSTASQSIEAGGKASRPSDPTRPHYDFSGWTLNGSAYNFSSAVNSSIALDANWLQKVIKIISTQVDPYSPDVRLSVTEDGQDVPFSSIRLNGVEVANASNPYTSKNELSNGTYNVTLSDGTVLEASL